MQNKKILLEPSTLFTGISEARWLHIIVTNTLSNKTLVNVRLPLGVVTAGIKMGARFAPEVEGLDMDLLMEYIHSGETGKVSDITDEEDHERVEVDIES